MLVLSRKPNQSIRIGDDIEIVVTRICGSTARLAVRAPKDVAITRSELLCEPFTESSDDRHSAPHHGHCSRSEPSLLQKTYSRHAQVLASY